MPRLRRFPLSRSPFVFWVAVAALALVTASVVAGAVGRARSLSARYGPLRPVVVAARPVGQGVAVVGPDLVTKAVPASLAPDGAFASVDQVRGRTAVVPLAAGQPVLPGHLAPDGLSGVAALLPPGSRAVSVPAGSTAPPMQRGDRVDVLATLEASPTLAVALDAPVVDVAEDTATVAVSPEEARAVAYALAHGSVTVALTPGPGHAGPRGPPAPAAPATRAR